MVNLAKGTFSLDLGFASLRGELADQDRQCAWELYTELSTRVAVTGKPSDDSCTSFEGEIYAESLASLYAFFGEARRIMRQFPVGAIGVQSEAHLGTLISRMFENVLRPFLETWQADYRHWWEHASNPRVGPFERQREYPQRQALEEAWASVRWLLREAMNKLVAKYKLHPRGSTAHESTD